MDSKTLREWRKALNASLIPLEVDDARFVKNLHGSGEDDVIERLRQRIEDTEGSSAIYYFTGQRGAGKSTELRRLRTELEEGDVFRCVLFDALAYINETQPITVEILMLMVAVGVRDWLEAKYPSKDFTSSPIQRFGAWLTNTEVELKQIEIGGICKLDLKDRQTTIDEKLRKLTTQHDFLNQLRNYTAEMVLWLGKQEEREIVILVDSLERLRGASGKDGADMFDSVARVFGDQFDHLRVERTQIVYAVPPYLCLLENVRVQLPWYALASVRVFETPSKARRKPRDQGLKIMQLLVKKRMPDWQQVLKPEALQRLALCSGGDLRHFMFRLLEDALYRAQYALDRLPLDESDPIVASLENASRVEMTQLTVRDEWGLLRRIAQGHEVVAENREQFRTLAHLFDTRVILNYRNGEEWYDLHPSLWATIDAAGDAAP